MDRTRELKTIQTVHDDRMKMIAGKAQDYATEDVLSNFKRMTILCKELDIDVRRSPGDCARFLFLLKLDRWCNLNKKGAVPLNESIRDTVLDGHNYWDLAYLCDMETLNGNNEKSGTSQ